MSVIDSRAFLDALVVADVIRRGDKVLRVVIDARLGQPLVMHVERFGDERVLAVAQTLTGVEITTIEPAEPEEWTPGWPPQ